ncbi:MAG: hypothetical protein Q9188_004037 [Gyalolechia gomerana]
MKEEALLEYNDALIDFDFMNYAHPQPPLRFLMNAEIQRMFYAQVKRSTVLWTINALAVDMMRTRYLHHLPFKVTSYSELIYSGFLTLEGDPTTEQPPPKNLSEVAKTLSHPLYLAAKPINSTSFSLHSYSKLRDHPAYTIEFAFVPSGTELSAYLMFRAFLALLLQLAKADAATTLPRTSIMQPDLQAWVFMRPVQHPQSRYVFQQFHAVALVEAMARYMQLQAKFREMTFQFHADGQLLADGCVVRGVQYRRWCFGLYMGDDAGTADVDSS